MRFVEAGLGLRSSIVELRHPGGPLKFVLFPMVHMADPAFYAAVTERLRTCDIVVMEGVRRPRRLFVSRYEFGYRCLRWGRARLTLQNVSPERLGLPTVRPDEVAWPERFLNHFSWLTFANPLTLHKNLALMVYLPVRALLLSRAALAEILNVEFDPNELPYLDKLTVHRDEELVSALLALHDEHSARPLRVAVVYGAFHMPTVVTSLRERHRYSPRAAEWITVFDYD